MPAPLQTALWLRRAQWMLDQCAARFGDTFTLRIVGQGTWVVVSDPADVEAVFRAPGDVLHAGEGNRIMEPVLGARSVLLLDERDHLEQRRLLLPAFSGARVARYGELIAGVAAAEIDHWPRGEAQRLRPRMQALTLEVILRAVLGITDPERREALRVELRRMLGFLTDPRRAAMLLVLGPRVRRLPSFRRAVDRVDRLLYAEIAERRRADLGSREDIMSLLIGAAHEDGTPMSDVELRDELLTLLLAGHETTANALAWAGERLARRPEVLEKLAQEARAGVETTYARAVVQETLRLRPVLPIAPRLVKRPFARTGRELAPGTIIAPALYLVGRRPEIYPDPERFSPERFLAGAPGTYTWIPFGGGVRRCLGAAFAQYEMETVLHSLAARAVIRPVRAGPEPVLRRAIIETPRHDAEVLVL